MDNIIYLSDRNRVVEKYLYCIDKVIRQKWALIQAAHLDRDDVYQQLAIRLMRCVDTYDQAKGNLEQHILAQLRYELLNYKKMRRLLGITGTLKDFRQGKVISLDAIREDSGLYQDYLAA